LNLTYAAAASAKRRSCVRLKDEVLQRSPQSGSTLLTVLTLTSIIDITYRSDRIILNMDLRKLEVFCKLMETRSFSRTAEEISLRQPTVSGHIKTLEEEIGIRLFDRDGREVLPTSAAEVLYGYALRILDLRTEAGYALEQFMGRVGGQLKIGGSTIPGGYILPILMGKFHQRYQEAFLSLVLDDTKGIVERVLSGEIEIGVVGAEIGHENLEYRLLLQDELVLTVPPDHPWAATGVLLDVRDLTKTPFILREPGSGTRTTMLNALKRLNIGVQDLNVIAEMGSTEAVRHNLIKAVEVPGLNLKRQFYIVINNKRTRSPLCQVFLGYLGKNIPESLQLQRGKHE